MRNAPGLEFCGQGLATSGQQVQIAADGHDTEPLSQPVARVGLDRSEDAGGFPRFADAATRVLDGSANFCVIRVAKMAQRCRQIARANEQAVHALDCRYRLDVLDCGTSFNLHEHTKLVMDPFEIILHSSVAVCAVRDSHAPNARRRVSSSRDGSASLGGILHVRNEQVLRADVEQPLYEDGIIPSWSHYGRGCSAAQS